MKTVSIPGGFRSSSALAVGSVANGVLAYVFFAVTTRALGADAAAPVTVLWAWWAFAAAAFTFPVQHWITRSVTAHGGEARVRAAMPNVARLVLMISMVVWVVAWLLRDPLFHGQGAAFSLLAATITAGSALTGYVRGVLTARKRFGAVSVALGAENLLRCLLALALVSTGVSDPIWYGLVLLIGFVAALVWPSVLWLPNKVTGIDDDSAPADGTFSFLSGAAGGQLIGQAVLTGGPLVLTLSGGGPREVTALFAGLALFRAPYTLGIGMVAQLTGRITGMLVGESWDSLDRVRGLLRLATGVGVLVAIPVGGLAGPPLLRLIFGGDVILSSGDCILIAIASAVALANLVATVMLLAQERTLVLTVVWAIALIPGVLIYVSRSGNGSDPLTSVCWAFLVVETAAMLGLQWAEWRGVLLRRRAADPGDWSKEVPAT